MYTYTYIYIYIHIYIQIYTYIYTYIFFLRQVHLAASSAPLASAPPHTVDRKKSQAAVLDHLFMMKFRSPQTPNFRKNDNRFSKKSVSGAAKFDHEKVV